MNGGAGPEPTIPVLRTMGKLLLGVGLVAGLVWWVAPSWEDVAGRFALSVPWLVVSLAGSLVATVVTAARWKRLSEAMGAMKLPYGVYFHWLALTRVIGQFVPTVVVDLLGRTAALRAAGSTSGMGHLMTSVVIERLFDLLLPVVMLGWAWSAYQEVAGLSPFLTLGLTTLLFSAAAIPMLQPTAALALRTYAWLKRTPDVRHVPPISTRLAAQIIGLSLLRYAGILVQYLGAGAGFGVLLAPLVLLSAAPAAQAAGVIGVTPGGLGLQEGGWTAVLSSLGQPASAIVVFIAGARVMMVLNFGILALASWRWRTVTQPAAPSPSPK